MAKNDTLKTASVLAFERKLDPSDALLYASKWDKRQDEQQWQPVKVREKIGARYHFQPLESQRPRPRETRCCD